MIYSLKKGGTRPLYPSTTSTQSSHFNLTTRNVSSIPETWWMHIFASSSVSNQFPKSPRYLARRRQMYAGVTSAWIWALFDTPRFMNEHKLLHSSPVSTQIKQFSRWFEQGRVSTGGIPLRFVIGSDSRHPRIHPCSISFNHGFQSNILEGDQGHGAKCPFTDIFSLKIRLVGF